MQCWRNTAEQSACYANPVMVVDWADVWSPCFPTPVCHRSLLEAHG